MSLAPRGTPLKGDFPNPIDGPDFPCKGGIHPDESGQGYALRMAEANGLQGLWPIKRLLGKSHSSMLDERDALRLAQWFGAEPNALTNALGTPINGRGEGGEHRYAGMRIARRQFVDRWRPRVCVACLEQSGYCRIDWDFTLVTACPIHDCRLTSHCPCCDSRLTWNRPALGVCGTCHERLAEGPLDCDPIALELQVAAWTWNHGLERRPALPEFPNENISTATGPSGALHRLIGPLRLNAGWSVAYALASLSAYASKPIVAAQDQHLPKPARLLVMANAVAERIERREFQLRVSRPASVVQLLADMASGDATTFERQLAWSLLGLVMRDHTKARWTGVNPQLAQATLF